jgi:hypothetical protein
MKKSEFKKLIKPIVDECIKESLTENGLISSIIVEVVKGMSTATLISETPEPEEPEVNPMVNRMKRNAFENDRSNKLQQQKNKLMAALGEEAYNGVNLFEGTTPAATQMTATQQASPLSGQPSTDPGVDISNLFGSVGRNWNAHMLGVKEGK